MENEYLQQMDNLIEQFHADIRAIFCPGSEETEEGPWYPDDSGEWIECNGKDPGLPPHTLIDVVLRSDRLTKCARELQMEAGGIEDWGHRDNPGDIVACKIIKTEAERLEEWVTLEFEDLTVGIRGRTLKDGFCDYHTFVSADPNGLFFSIKGEARFRPEAQRKNLPEDRRWVKRGGE